MKNLYLTCFFSLCVLLGFSQNEKMYIMENGTVIFESAISEIDSMIFYKPTTSAFSVNFELDSTTVLKNPYMGWSLYTEGGKIADNPTVYWYRQKDASQYAGTFYLRWPWSRMESEEGVYAWDTANESQDALYFRGLIAGALERNLRLAFRVIVNGRDHNQPATPQYVLDEAATYEVLPGHQTPYADDEFFLEKYTKFIRAFGEKFNDPTTVDYVDSYGLGYWGEEHNIKYQNSANKYASHDSIVTAYAEAFDKVINVVNFGARDAKQQAVAFNDLGISPRRDGYASQYFPVSQQTGLKSHFPGKIIIAEACYWGDTPIRDQENGRWSTWTKYYEDVVDLALNTHANYLDMRTHNESTRYMEVAMDQVEKFIAKGGYRIYPKSVEASAQNQKLTLSHTWLNAANGVLPNNNVSLGYKYKVAFALFDNESNIVKKHVSNKVEVSDLVNQTERSGNDEIDIADVESGTYKLAVAIINTRENDSKDIKLAIKDAKIITGEWVEVGEIKFD